MSLEMATISSSFLLDITDVQGKGAQLQSVFNGLGNVGQGMAQGIDQSLDQVVASMDQVGIASAIASGKVRETGTAAQSASASMLAQSSAADQAATSTNQAAQAAGHASQSIQQLDSASEQASRGLNKGSTEAESFSAAVMRLEGDINKVGMGLAGFGTLVVGGLGIAAGAASSFEAAMQNVNSIAGLSDDALRDLSDSVLELGPALGKGPVELAEGLYDLLSSGLDASEAMVVLEKSAIAAGAGLTSTAVASKAITAVLNAYGKSADEAGDVSDVLFKIVDSGVLTFENLASNIGAILPLAAALKVPIEEVAAAYSLMTLSGQSAAATETAIAAIMRSAIQPTEELAAAVENYGYSSAEALIQAEGLVGYLNLLMTASGGSSEALSALVGTGEAAAAVLSLIKNNGSDFTGMLAEMTGSMQDGAYTLGVFQEQTDSTQFAIQQFGASLAVAKVQAGDAILPLVRLGAEAGTAVVSGFNGMSEATQTLIAGTAGLVGALSLSSGAFLLALPKVVEFKRALEQVGGAAGVAQKGVTVLRFAFNPLTLAIVAAVAIGVKLFDSWQKQREAAENYEKSLLDLGDTIELLRRRGDTELADLAAGFSKFVEETPAKIDAMNTAINQSLADKSGGQWIQDRQAELVALGETEADAWKLAYAEYEKYSNGVTVEIDKLTAANAKLNEALNDPNVDVVAWLEWSTGLLNAATTAEELQAAYDKIDATPLSEFSKTATDAASTTGKAADDMVASAEDISAAFNSTKQDIWDLEFEGMDQAAKDVQALSEAFKLLEEPMARTTFVYDEATDSLIQGTEWISLSAAGLEEASYSYQKLVDVLSSGDYDNAQIIADILNIIATAPTPDTASAAIRDYINDIENLKLAAADAHYPMTQLGDAVTVTSSKIEGAADAYDGLISRMETLAGKLEQLDKSSVAMAEGAERTAAYEAALQDVNNAMIEWLGNGDNILGFLESYLSTTNSSAVSTVQMAQSLVQASSALDSMLGIYKEIDSLAKRSAESESIASTLIGAPGEMGTLQDLWTRINDGTSNATLSANEYNAAIGAGVKIQESNARVQDYIVSIQAKQLPLLAEQQAAYEEQLQALEGMSAEQQQYTLYLQSTNGQAQIATAYATAYSASIGEIPESVATELIANSAKADPVLAGVLEEMGLISYGAKGEIIVDFPDGPTVQDTIIELTRSIDALIEVMDGVPPLHARIDGEETVRKYIDDLTAFLEDDHDITITADTDQPTSAVDRLRSALDNLTGGESGEDPVTRLGNALKNLKVPELDLDVKWGDPPLASDFLAPELPPLVQEVILSYGPSQQAPTGPAPGGSEGGGGVGHDAPQSIPMPAIDSTAFDLSLTEINAKINQTFGVDVPTSIGIGMTTSGAAIMTNATLWPTYIDAVAPVMAASGVNAGSVAGYGTANGMASANGAISDNAAAWPPIVDGIAGAMGTAGYNAGAAAGYGVANGMASALGSIQSTAAQIAAIVTSTLALQLLIASPSKVTTRLGEFVGEGFALGIASKKSDVERASQELAAAAEGAFSAASRVQVPGGVSVEPGTPGGGGGGGSTPPKPTTPTEPEKTIERDLMGIINPVKDAVAALGLGIDIAAKTMFSEEGWKAREQALGLTKALEIGDLFARRAANQSFANGTFIPGTGSRYTEHYGSPLIPDIANIPDPTKPPVDPTKPGGGVKVKTGFVTPRGEFPNRPNTGGRSQAPVVVQETHYHTTDSRTLYTPEPERFSEMLSAARDGRTASRVLSNARGGRTQSRGLSRT